MITGASSGFGELSAKALARAGHTVYATMLDPSGRNATVAEGYRQFAAQGADLRVVELDVSSSPSAEDAVARIVSEAAGSTSSCTTPAT